MGRKNSFGIDEFYHLYNRGTDKRTIFLDRNDYHRFIMLLYFCNNQEPADLQKVFREGRTFTEFFSLDRGKPLVAIGAWCLMPNHFHILIKEITDAGITTFMRKVMTGYSMYFNKKHDRNGSLFQGKFKSEHADKDEYLKYLFSYIHLNPVKLIPDEAKWKEIGIQDKNNTLNFLSNYEYSSLKSYTGKNSHYEKILHKETFPEYFPTKEMVLDEIIDWLSYKNESVKVGPSQNI